MDLELVFTIVLNFINEESWGEKNMPTLRGGIRSSENFVTEVSYGHILVLYQK